MVRPAPIEVLLEDISRELMIFILNNSDYHYVEPMMEFQTSNTEKGYSRHDKASRLRANIVWVLENLMRISTGGYIENF